MAAQSFSTSFAGSVQQWDEGLEAEVLRKVSFPAFAGKRSDSAFQIKDKLAARPGYQINFGLRMQLSGTPKSSTQTLTGNEQNLTLHYDSIVIEEIAEAILWKNVIDRQRVTFDMLSEAKAALGDFLAGAIDQGIFNQLAGYTDETELTLTGNNSVTAVDADHIFYGGDATSEADMDSADPFTLDLIDIAVEKAKTLTPPIRPAYIPWLGESLYLCFVHPYQVTSMRAADTRFDVTYRQILAGGGIKDNPLLTGELPIWNGTLIVESSRVPQGMDATNGASQRRAIFCGAQSLSMGWGRFSGNPNRFSFIPEFRDFKREAGVAGSAVFGAKTNVFNSAYFGNIVISTWAAAS